MCVPRILVLHNSQTFKNITGEVHQGLRVRTFKNWESNLRLKWYHNVTLLTFFKNNSSYFWWVYIVENGAYPCQPLIRVQRAKEWGEVDETTAPNLLFSSCIWGKWGVQGRCHSQQSNHISTWEWGAAAPRHPKVPDVEHVPRVNVVQ